MAPRSRFREELRTAVTPQPVATWLADGVTREQLRGPGWCRTSYGFYRPIPATSAGRTPTQRILDAAALAPPDAAIGGWAAAFVHGVDILDGIDSFTMTEIPVLLCLGRDLGRRSTGRVRYSRDRLPPADVCLRHGLPVTAPLRTAFDGARLSDGLAEAVAFLDACAHERIITLTDLAAYIATHRADGWSGIEQVRRALALADMATRNLWESRLRVLAVREAGVPKPLVNCPVFDVAGGFAGIPDLLDPEAGVVLEFDGQGHRDRRQHRADNVREERFESLGLIVARADSLDLMHHRVDLVRRVVDAYARGRRRDRAQDRWTLVEPDWWLEQTDPSELLTDAEKAELLDW